MAKKYDITEVPFQPQEYLARACADVLEAMLRKSYVEESAEGSDKAALPNRWLPSSPECSSTRGDADLKPGHDKIRPGDANSVHLTNQLEPADVNSHTEACIETLNKVYNFAEETGIVFKISPMEERNHVYNANNQPLINDHLNDIPNRYQTDTTRKSCIFKFGIANGSSSFHEHVGHNEINEERRIPLAVSIPRSSLNTNIRRPEVVSPNQPFQDVPAETADDTERPNEIVYLRPSRTRLLAQVPDNFRAVLNYLNGQGDNQHIEDFGRHVLERARAQDNVVVQVELSSYTKLLAFFLALNTAFIFKLVVGEFILKFLL